MEKQNLGVAQFFYHCMGEELPIRDILNTQYHGSKTEPHYENLTENWCNMCMNARIRSANRNKLDYLFLFTRYINEGHKNHNKYLIVGYLKKAQKNRWIELNKTLTSGANEYIPQEPENCGYFAGDERESKFVSAEHAYILKELKHPYYLWYIDDILFRDILKKLKRGNNIIKQIRKRAEILKRYHKNNSRNESCSASCRH